MTRRAVVSTRPGSDGAAVVQAVTVIMGVVGLALLFGFGKVLNLALRLGVPAWVAPLVALAVDLSILGPAHEVDQPKPTVQADSDDVAPEAEPELDEDLPQHGDERAIVARTPEALLARAR